MKASADRIESILAAAVEIDAESERRQFVDEACAGDHELKRQVEELIENHFRAGSFLESPAAVFPGALGHSPRREGHGEGAIATTDEPISERPGTIIGPYKLLEQIGEGGFGVVFMAEQTQPVRRKVALKVLKPGMDTRQVIARFEAERQALALMDHPNIAKVLDAGQTSSSRPYFAMDLVRGVPITEFCDQTHLTPKERLELFVHVCQAVQHAHQKGIIHRDLKPSNVLVTMQDGVPLVKVIDFGVAKALGQELTDKTLFTGFDQMIGTPLYMSPEQAGQSPDIDTRSDIYSLGVLLYELLTGTTPFDKERLKTAGYDEMRRIIREEEPPKPSTRIITLGRSGLPSRTSPTPSPARQAGPTAHAHTTDVSTIAAQRKSHPKRLSQLFRGELDWIVMKALEKDRNRRYETASAFAADVQRYLNNEVVAAGPPSAWYRIRKFARRNKTRLALAACVLALLIGLGSSAIWFARQRAIRQAETEQAVTAALAQAETLLAEGDKQIDNPERWQATARLAQAALEKAQELLAAGSGTEDLVARVEEVRAAVDAAVNDSRLLVQIDHIRLEEAAVKDGHFDVAAAAPLYAELFEKYGIDVATPESAAARVRDSRLREALLSALADWERVSQDEGERKRLGEAYQLALPPDSPRLRLMAAMERRDTTELAKLAREPSFQDLPPATLVVLANRLANVKEWVAAEELLRARLERKPGDFWLNHNLGMVLLAQGRAAEAVGYLRAALALRSDSPGVFLNLGGALRKTGNLDGAIHCYQSALQIDPQYVMAHDNLGLALQEKGDLDGAIRCFQMALQIDANNVSARFYHANALQHRGDLEQAVREYRALLEIDPEYAELHSSLGSALLRNGLADAATAEFREAIRFKKDLHELHCNLAYALVENGRLDEAIAEYRDAIRLKEDCAEAHCNLSHALLPQGRFQQAVEELRRGHELGSRRPDWPYPSKQWLRNAERLTQLEPRLPGLLKGETQATDPAERLALAYFASVKQLYAAAARFYGDTFAADPKLEEDLEGGCRYEAACNAARAGCGHGKDGPQLSEQERARLRRQALDWLRTDLTSWSKLLAADRAKTAPAVQAQMRRWLLQPDFAGVRAAEALAKLPDTERARWQELWADVKDNLKAQPNLERVRQATEAALRNEHLEALTHKLDQALLYHTQGKYDEAQTLFQEVLQASEELGVDHPVTLRCKRELAQLYLFQGKYDRAETLYLDVLQRQRANVGPDDPETLSCRADLARVYLVQGKYDRAEPILEKVVQAQTASLGAHHLDTLFYKGLLANLYGHRENYDRAEMLFQEVVQAETAKLGADNPETLASKHNLALVYFDQGKDDLAERLLQEVLLAQRTKLPPDHPGTLSCKKSLASVYLNRGQFEQAEPLFREVLQARTAKLGGDHLDTLDCKHGLARLYYAQGQTAKAEPLFREAVDGMRRTVGIEHPNSQRYTHNLALCYQRMKRPEKAEELLRELVDFAQQHTGADSPQYAGHLAALGLPLLEQNRPTEAEKVLRESLAICERKNPDAWKTFNTRSILGGTLLAQKKYADAEPLLLQGYDGMKRREAKIKRMDRVVLIDGLERLVQLYDAWGKKEKAEEWRKKLGAERAGK